MRLSILLATVVAVLVASSSLVSAQNVLLFTNPGSTISANAQDESLVNIEAYIDIAFPAAVKTSMTVADGCTFFETFDIELYDIIFYMKYDDWANCQALAEPRVEAFANAGGVFVFAGSFISGAPPLNVDGAFVSWFGGVSASFIDGPWAANPSAPAACDLLIAGATTMPSKEFLTIGLSGSEPTISCATAGNQPVWAVNANTMGPGVIVSLADATDNSLFNNDASFNNAIDNLMMLAATNGGMTDPHIFSRPIFGSRTHSHELVSLLTAHSLGTRDSLLASPTWVQVAVSDQAEVSCLLGSGQRDDGTYFTGLRIDAGGDSLRLASVAEGDDLLLGVEGSDGVMDMCTRGSEEQLEYQLAGGLAHVTVTCDMAEAREKLEGDAFMMGHVGWTKGRTQARVEVRTTDYLVVAYYVQQTYSANIARWRGEQTGFFNVEARPLPRGVFGGLFGNSLEAGMQEMRAVASSPSEAEARLVASFLHQE